MATAKLKKISFSIPFLGIGGDWEIDDLQQKAAWEIYVELVTRVTVVELKKDEGILREAMNSFYSVFGTTREILKRYGPSIAVADNATNITLGHIAVGVLNKVLRPFMAKWHPLLEAYEKQRPVDISVAVYENNWPYADEMRAEMAEIRAKLTTYADVLAEVSGVSKLH